ncbi:OmpP1/FadL family transporter [Nonlabens xiamenensis]|uniref:OmpP1/FadL family transporter n=1 Tax=Nonlabens xiamenensis TaxID=2341043 RepID=UPI000F609481|nr:outer membrane protein transport protein [Nonlabens xiamenensis]
MKYIIFYSALFCALFSTAQNLADGLEYTGTDLSGTARYRALSGAFGALGGDLSAMGNNPAGSVVFANNYAGFTLTLNRNNNSTTYFGSGLESNNSDFTIGQAGGVLVFKNTEETSLTKFAFGLNYDMTRNYDNSVNFRGTSPTSVSNYFLNNANGIALENFTVMNNETVGGLYQFLGEEFGFGGQIGFLGYESFLLNAVDENDPNNTQYLSATGTGSFDQDYLRETTGSQSKISFNASMQLNNKWNFGINLNSHVLNYERLLSIIENNTNADASVNNVRFDNLLVTEGSGFSAQLGFIGKITESFRIGATYESPTWYRINESNSQDISTISNNGGNSSSAFVQPNVINVFAPYDLRSPGSLTGSLAYIFNKKGLISFDYTTRDYSRIKFSPDSDPLFATNNDLASSELTRASSIRLGAEYRIKRLSLRGGYRIEQTPYENEDIMGDLTGYSLGLGYTWGSTTLDLSYDRAERDYSQQLFDTGLTTSGNVQNTRNNIVLTLGFNL